MQHKWNEIINIVCKTDMANHRDQLLTTNSIELQDNYFGLRFPVEILSLHGWTSVWSSFHFCVLCVGWQRQAVIGFTKRQIRGMGDGGSGSSLQCCCCHNEHFQPYGSCLNGVPDKSLRYPLT